MGKEAAKNIIEVLNLLSKNNTEFGVVAELMQEEFSKTKGRVYRHTVQPVEAILESLCENGWPEILKSNCSESIYVAKKNQYK